MENVDLKNQIPADAKPVLNAVAVKLSKAQLEIIKAMQDGIICHYMQGLNARCFLARTQKNISWTTIYKLETLGLIERNDRFVVLTEQGRSYCI